MGRPAKLALVDYFSKAIWYQMGSLQDMDKDGKGYLTQEDVAAAVSRRFGEEVASLCVANVMHVADVNKVHAFEILRILNLFSNILY